VFPPEVLYLIRAIIYPNPHVTLGSALSPFARPDGAQVVLLCWGQVAPWSWTIWNDTRFADMELITQLVSLYWTRIFVIIDDGGLDSCLDMSRRYSVSAHAVDAPSKLAEAALTRFKVKFSRCSNCSYRASFVLTKT
jgi:hypothetical protein